MKPFKKNTTRKSVTTPKTPKITTPKAERETPIIHKLTQEERETYISIDEIDKTWIADTTIPKDMNKFKKQGWEVLSTDYYPDGAVRGMKFKAPRKAITIGKAVRPKRDLTDEQRKAMSYHMKNIVNKNKS